MNICFIIDNPGTTTHPVIGTVLQRLGLKHTVRLVDVRTLTGDAAIAQEASHPLADIYLLKSHTLQALQVAHHLEQRGALVVNSWASSVACQDRILLAQRMREACLPWPSTWSFLPSEDAPRQHFLSTLPFPLIIKSRYSCRGDLVEKVHDVERLQALLRQRQRKQESFILQEFVHGDSRDIKLWVIGQQVFAACRPTPLEANGSEETLPVSPERIPSDWRSIALEIGPVFGLHVYGADLIMAQRGPIVVDVNSFPGFRGVAGADSALIALIERLISGL